jgi:Coenzyme PQQ synthesis protein D (PqqD)
MDAGTISASSTVVASGNQMSREVGEETVILSFDEGTYYGLNDVGTRVWALIQEPRSVADVCATISREYDVEPERCEADVLELLRELAREELVEVRK